MYLFLLIFLLPSSHPPASLHWRIQQGNTVEELEPETVVEEQADGSSQSSSSISLVMAGQGDLVADCFAINKVAGKDFMVNQHVVQLLSTYS